MKAIEASGGKFDILKSGDEHLQQIFRRVKTIKSKEVVIDNANNNEYLAVTTISGTDWYFVTVFPVEFIYTHKHPNSPFSPVAYRDEKLLQYKGVPKDVCKLKETHPRYWRIATKYVFTSNYHSS